MFPLKNKSLIVNRSNIKSTSINESSIVGIDDGQVLLEVDQFALTANNVTYAAIGEMMQYWNFFPTAVEGHGIVPVWGYAKVIASKSPEIKEGTLLYGYLPMSEYFVAEPGRIAPHGFRDMAAHRQKNAPIYNNYDFVQPKQYSHPSSPYLPVIRPLFTTSFLLYHFFTDEKFMGAKHILLSSASSKTAMALASMLKENKDSHSINICGITSSSNKEFVLKTGLYDTVYSYDEVKELLHEGTVIADFAGNKGLLKEIDDHLTDHLIFISAIGLTDWESNKDQTPVPKAKFFFAPTYAEVKLKEWGPAQGMKMIQEAMMKFIAVIAPQIAIQNISGFDDMQSLFIEMVDGKVNPKHGNIIKPN